MKTQHHRAVWLSDLHLGSKDCKVDFLLDFFNSITTDTLYLVGDIVDMWQMSKQFHWPEKHNEVLHKIMHMSQNGTRVVYLPGNHDAPIQTYDGMAFGNVDIEREVVHTMANGKRYLVLHGDQFDGDVTLGKFETWLGDKAYTLLLILNRWYNRFRQWKTGDYWSLAGYIKQHIRGANAAIARYRHACCAHAKAKRLDGVICGHIHHPESEIVEGVHYINDGDWVENCSVLVESHNGELTLFNWVHEMQSRKSFSLIPTNSNLPDKAA
jgi:UDP-2,3-diacylglucosamine pyrophosphatase LpxH